MSVNDTAFPEAIKKSSASNTAAYKMVVCFEKNYKMNKITNVVKLT